MGRAPKPRYNIMPLFAGMKGWSVVIGLLLFCVSALLAQPVSKGPAPAFVLPVEMPPPSGVSKYELESGVYYALMDVQYDGVTETDYTHKCFEVLTNKGVEEISQFSVLIDTSYQHLVFHSLLVHREGQALDRTAELSFEILRQEAELQKSLYTGTVNVHGIVPDVRKGDRIEFAYSIVGKNPIFNGHVDWSTFLSAPSAIGLLEVRVVLPTDRQYVVDCNRCEGYSVDDGEKKDRRIIRVHATKVPQWPREVFIAPGIRPFSSLNIADFTDWASVNRWALDVLAVPPADSLAAITKRLTKGNLTQKQNIEALIDFVQDDIRYMSIANGLGSHKPRPASQILSKRFGDCKDKSVLLAGMLRCIGVSDAFPALVSSHSRDLLSRVKPSVHRFDHCIVNFTYEGRQYWIDPVIAEQGGSLDSICIPEYHLALIVRTGTDSLTPIPATDRYSRLEVDETLSFTDYTEEGEYKVVIRNFGLTADMARASIEQVGANDMADAIRKRLALAFPNIGKAKDIVIKDDLRPNILTMSFIASERFGSDFKLRI